MQKVTINAETEQDAREICLRDHHFYPDAVREVDSGDENERAWMLFESAEDARIWDNQT